jgi:hypothetical protein
LFCTHAENTLLMENTGAPTDGMASSSWQDIHKVISSFLRQYFFCVLSCFVFNVFY